MYCKKIAKNSCINNVPKVSIPMSEKNKLKVFINLRNNPRTVSGQPFQAGIDAGPIPAIVPSTTCQ